MSTQYEEILQSISKVKKLIRGTILDLIPLKQIHEVLQNATDRLPADFLCASHSRGQS